MDTLRNLIAGSVLAAAMAVSSLAQPARAQGTLIWGGPAAADALDPQAMGGWIGRAITNQIYESLLKENLTDPTATNAKLEPDLAMSWQVTDGGKVWTFELRSGVKFQDGTPFDAEAVKFNFDRFLDPKAPQYYQKSTSFMSGFAKWIDHVDVLGPMKIQVTLKEPNYEWFQSGLQSYGQFLIMSPAAINKYGNDAMALHPVGTGPFKFVSREEGVKIVLARNEDYWGPKAKLDSIIFLVLSDNSTRVNALRSGEINFVTSPPWDNIGALTKAGFVLTKNENVPSLWYLHINTRNPILADVRVRQAINYAFNSEGMVKDVMKGTATAAYNMLSRGTYAFDPTYTPTSTIPRKRSSSWPRLATRGRSWNSTSRNMGPTLRACQESTALTSEATEGAIV